MKKHNFYAGPSILPEFTIENTAKAVKDFAGTGLSILEISHRSKEFIAVMDEAIALFKELIEYSPGILCYFPWRRCKPAVCNGTIQSCSTKKLPTCQQVFGQRKQLKKLKFLVK